MLYGFRHTARECSLFAIACQSVGALLLAVLLAGPAGAQEPPLRLSLTVEQGSVPAGEALRLVQSDLDSSFANDLSLISAGGGDVRFRGIPVFSGDGRWLIASTSESALGIWEVDSARSTITRWATLEDDGTTGIPAVSPDSAFVFVGSNGALGAWRLNANANAEDARLTQIAVYRDGVQDAAGNTITASSVDDIIDIALSPDGSLLFASHRQPTNALSVWSINPSSGMLALRDMHTADGTNGLNRAARVAVSPDGQLLFVGSFYSFSPSDFPNSTLSIWEVDSTGMTVRNLQTIRDVMRLPRPRTLAVSPDGGLLFAGSQVFAESADGSDNLSVWEVSADGTLTGVGSYGGLRSDPADFLDLGAPISMAVTREILLVAGFLDDLMTLWRLNPDGSGGYSGIGYVDTYTNGEDAFTYRPGASTIAGLREVNGVAASPAGGLVATINNVNASVSDFPPTLSLWRVEGIPRVPSDQEVVVTVNLEPMPTNQLQLVIEARQGGRTVTETVTFMPGSGQTRAVFPAGALGSGEWSFQAVPADGVEIPARPATVRINLISNGAEITLENLSGSVRQGADLAIRLTVSIPFAEDVDVTVLAEDDNSNTEMTETGMLPAGQSSVVLTFRSLTEGDWTLSAVLGRLRLVTTSGSAELAVSILPLAKLILAPAMPDVLGPGVTINLSADAPLPRDVEVTVSAEREDDGQSTSMSINLLRGDGLSPPTAVVTFSARTLFGAGAYIFRASQTGGGVAVLADATTTTAVVRTPNLRVMPMSGMLFSADREVRVQAISSFPPGVEVTLTPIAQGSGSPPQEVVSDTLAILAADATATVLVFPVGVLSAGQWIISASAPSGIFSTISTTTLTVLASPKLRLVPERDKIVVGDALPVRVISERAPPADVTVTVLASRYAEEVEIQVTLEAGSIASEAEAVATFPEPGLEPGPWLLSISELDPPGLLDTSDARAGVTVAASLALAAEQVGGIVQATLSASAMLSQPVAVTLAAVSVSEPSSQHLRVVTLEASALSAQVQFEAGLLSPGRWIFRVSRTSPSGLFDETAAETTLDVREVPVLSLLSPVPSQVARGEAVLLRLGTDRAPGLDVMLEATASLDNTTQTVTVSETLGADATTAVLAFAMEDALTEEGMWTLVVSTTPAHAVQLEENVSTSVQVTVPRLRLETAEPPRYRPGVGVTITAVATALNTASYEIVATPSETSLNAIMMSSANDGTSLETSFTFELPNEISTWDFHVELMPDSVGLLDVSAATATVTLQRVQLSLEPIDSVFVVVGDAARFLALYDAFLGEGNFQVQISSGGSNAETISVPVQDSSSLMQELMTPAIPATGTWMVEVSLQEDAVNIMADPLTMHALATSLAPAMTAESTSVARAEEAVLEITLPSALPANLSLQVGVTDPDGASQEPFTITVAQGTTSGRRGYPLASAGTWTFTLANQLGIVVFSNGGTQVQVVVDRPTVRLAVPSTEIILAGSTLGITVATTSAVGVPVTVMVQATLAGAPFAQALTTTVSVVLEAEETEAMALFGGVNALTPGQWIFTIAGVAPESRVVPTTTSLRAVVGPAMLELSVSPMLPPGAAAAVDVSVNTALAQQVSATVTATLQSASPGQMVSKTVILSTTASSVPAVFSSDELEAGTWRFEITAVEPAVQVTDQGEEFRLVDFANARATAALPFLVLEPPVGPVEPGTVTITVRTSVAATQELILQVIAAAEIGEESLERMAEATLATSATSVKALFPAGPEGLLSGTWTLTAMVMPLGGVSLRALEVTVQAPRLIMERRGPVSVAPGTPVQVRAMTAEQVMGEVSVTITARQPGRDDVERTVSLDQQAPVDAEFAGLPPGMWLFTAAAVPPEGLRTGSAIDTVTVLPAPLALAPRQTPVAAAADTVLVLSTPIPPGIDANVEVLATHTTSQVVVTRMAALAADATVTELVYLSGELTPGKWDFTVQASANIQMVLDLSATTTTVQISPARLELTILRDPHPLTALLAVFLTTDAPPGQEVMVTVRGTLDDSFSSEILEAVFPRDQQTAPAIRLLLFAGGEGSWTFRVTQTSPEGLLQPINTATVTVVRPTLNLELESLNFLATEPIAVSVSIDIPPGRLLPVTVTAEREGVQREAVAMVGADGQLLEEAIFLAGMLTAGRWDLTAVASRASTATASIYVLPQPTSVTSLTVTPPSVLPGEELLLTVTLADTLPAAVEVLVSATDPDARTSTVMIQIEAGMTIGMVEFALASRAGDWQFEVQTATVVTGGPTATATVLPPPLRLQAARTRVGLGTTASVLVATDAPPYVAVTVEVLAEHAVDDSSRRVTVTLAPLSMNVRVDFAGENALNILGEWTLGITEVTPSTVVMNIAETVTLEVQPQLMLAAPSSMVLLENAVEIRASVNAMLEAPVEATINAISPGRANESTTVVLAADVQSVTAMFEIAQLLPGVWTFFISTASQSVVVSTATVIVTVMRPTLSLLEARQESIGVRVTIEADAVVPSQVGLVVIVTATPTDDGGGERMAEIALSTSAEVVFSGDNALRPGTWNITLATTPTNVVNTDAMISFVGEVELSLEFLAPADSSPAGIGEETFPGDAARLQATANFGGEAVQPFSTLTLNVEVADGDSRPRDPIQIQVFPTTSVGRFSYVPDAAAGTWTFTATAAGDTLLSVRPAEVTAMLRVAGLSPPDFSSPSRGVNADDLTLLLRYLRLCSEGVANGMGPPLEDCTALDTAADRELNLISNLTGADVSYQFAELASLRLPDLTGNGMGGIDELVILLGALADVEESIVVPAVPDPSPENRQNHTARMCIIKQVLGTARPAEDPRCPSIP